MLTFRSCCRNERRGANTGVNVGDESNDVQIAIARKPICSVIAGATLILCLFVPFLLVTLPIMVAVGLSIAAAFRKEKPIWLPYVIGGLAVAFVVLANSRLPIGASSLPTLSNAETYKDAKWDYGSAKDAMRGTVSKWATLNSPTDLNLPAPYEGSNVASIQTSEAGGLILTVTKGQFLCHSDDTVAVKFDNGPVFNYPCSTPDNGQTETIYINNAYSPATGQPQNVVDGIAKGKTMVIEAQFYDAGSRQLTFNVAGLDKSKI